MDEGGARSAPARERRGQRGTPRAHAGTRTRQPHSRGCGATPISCFSGRAGRRTQKGEGRERARAVGGAGGLRPRQRQQAGRPPPLAISVRLPQRVGTLDSRRTQGALGARDGAAARGGRRRRAAGKGRARCVWPVRARRRPRRRLRVRVGPRVVGRGDVAAGGGDSAGGGGPGGGAPLGGWRGRRAARAAPRRRRQAGQPAHNPRLARGDGGHGAGFLTTPGRGGGGGRVKQGDEGTRAPARPPERRRGRAAAHPVAIRPGWRRRGGRGGGGRCCWRWRRGGGVARQKRRRQRRRRRVARRRVRRRPAHRPARQQRRRRAPPRGRGRGRGGRGQQAVAGDGGGGGGGRAAPARIQRRAPPRRGHRLRAVAIAPAVQVGGGGRRHHGGGGAVDPGRGRLLVVRVGGWRRRRARGRLRARRERGRRRRPPCSRGGQGQPGRVGQLGQGDAGGGAGRGAGVVVAGCVCGAGWWWWWWARVVASRKRCSELRRPPHSGRIPFPAPRTRHGCIQQAQVRVRGVEGGAGRARHGGKREPPWFGRPCKKR